MPAIGWDDAAVGLGRAVDDRENLFALVIATRPYRARQRQGLLGGPARTLIRFNGIRSPVPRYVDPDQARRQRHRLPVVQPEHQWNVAVVRRPRTRVLLSLVERVEPPAAVEVEVMDVRAMTISDVEQLLPRVDHQHHLYAQGLFEA